MPRKSLVQIILAVLLVTTQVACSRKASLTGADAKAMFQAQQTTSLDGLIDQVAVPDEYLIRRKGVAYLDSPEAFAEKNGLKFIKQIAGLGVEAFQTRDTATLTALQQAGEIEFVEPNYIRRLALPQQSGQQQVSPLVAQNSASWMSNPGRNHIYIGLVDTGVDTSHPDLKGKVMPPHNTLGTAGGLDDNGHGTFLAGLAVASNQQQQIMGIAPETRILPIKALDQNGLGTDLSVAEGIVKAVEYGAKVVLVSATGAQPSQTLALAIQYANQRQIPVVVPGGKTYPATDRGVLAVGATTSTGQQMASFSAVATTVAAPGQGLRSTFPMGQFALSGQGFTPQYGFMESGSGAAMQVAAAIALLKSTNPALTLPQVQSALMNASEPMQGSRRLNVARLSAVPGQMGAMNAPRTTYPQAYPQAYPAYMGYGVQRR